MPAPFTNLALLYSYGPCNCGQNRYGSELTHAPFASLALLYFRVKSTCADVRADVCVDMCVDMCVDTSVDMYVGLVCRDAGLHVPRTV